MEVSKNMSTSNGIFVTTFVNEQWFPCSFSYISGHSKHLTSVFDLEYLKSILKSITLPSPWKSYYSKAKHLLWSWKRDQPLTTGSQKGIRTHRLVGTYFVLLSSRNFDVCQAHRRARNLYCRNKECEVEICPTCKTINHSNHNVINAFHERKGVLVNGIVNLVE